MLTIIESAVWLKITGPLQEMEVIDKKFRFHPDQYWRADSYQIWEMTQGKSGWDGFTHPFKIIARKGEPLRAEMRRGFKDDLLEALKKANIQLSESSKLLNSPFRELVADDLPDDLVQGEHPLDEWQRNCIAQWLKHGFGNNRMAINAGKTMTFAAAASMIKRKFPDARFLYFTQTERLINQVVKELRNNFLPGWDIAQFGGGKNDLFKVSHQTGAMMFNPKAGSDIVVATGMSLNKNFSKLLKLGWFKTFMGVLVDESHHASSPSWEKVLMATPAFFRLGASDSLKEDDVSRHNVIRGLLGPVRGEVHTGDLIEVGRSAKPHIYVVDTPQWKGKYSHCQHAPEEDTEAWVLLDEEWKKGIYLGPALERAEPREDGTYAPAEEDGFKRVPAKKDRDGNFHESEKDGFKRDENGDTITIKVPSYHRVVIDKEEFELPSRWCLLDRLYDRAIIRFKERNALIATWAEYYSKKDLQTLVVCTRTLHVLILEALIKERVGEDMVKILFSEHNTKQRDKVFDWFRATPGAVLITPLVKEGVSINEIRAGVIADPVVDWEVANQIIGRFVRKKKVDNQTFITWLIDRQHPRFERNGIQLFKNLEKIRGYTFYYPLFAPDSIEKAEKFEALY